jgi:hypothetical protein
MEAVGDISDDRGNLTCSELAYFVGSRFELGPGSGIDCEVPAGPRQLVGKGTTESP